MNKYLVGMAIGPIYETIIQSRSIKEHWVASFLFSEISKNLIEEILIVNGHSSKEITEENESIKEVTLFAPAIKEDFDLSKEDYLGKYPDQIIFEVEAKDSGSVKVWLDSVIDKIKKGHKQVYSLDSLATDYFRIDYVVMDAETTELSELIGKLTIIDNGLSNYVLEKKLFIQNFFDADVKKVYTNKFDILSGKNQEKGNTNNEDQLDSIKNISSRSNFKDNYLLVYYDGNSVGNTLQQLAKNDKKKYIEASECLTEFSETISNMTEEFQKYRVLPLYIAGDDGFLLMPVSAGDNYYQTFLSKINDKYNEMVRANVDEKLTLRFSVVMAESNTPFKRLYDSVYNGLATCKDLSANLNASNNGNNVFFQILRSGAQAYSAVYAMGDEPKWLAEMLSNKEFKLNDEFLPNSVYERIAEFDYVYEDIKAKSDIEKDLHKHDVRYESFMKNIIELDERQSKIYLELASDILERTHLYLSEEQIDQGVKSVLNLENEQIYNLGRMMNYLDKRKGIVNSETEAK